MTSGPPLSWLAARARAYAAGRAARPQSVRVPLTEADGLVLAAPLTTLTPLPAFPTSSVDGYAVSGSGPWRLVGRALAGSVPAPLPPGTAMEIATGAMVPAGTEQIVRVEHATVDDANMIHGTALPGPEWREPGEEAVSGEELLPVGAPVTAGVVGLAAACGYDTLDVFPAPRVALVVFGDELLTSGPPGRGRVRDALGPQVPAWLRRFGAQVVPAFAPRGPVEDTLDAHIDAIRAALAHADLVATTGGTMHGPVDHLHPALAALGARYLANTVAVRPGFPMLLAEVPADDSLGGPTFVAGLPGNPQSAIVALVSLVAPLLAGLAGSAEPALGTVRLGAPVPGRGTHTHLALVRLDPDGLAHPLAHTGSAMLRGLARAHGFAVIVPGSHGEAGETVPFIPLPLPVGGPP